MSSFWGYGHIDNIKKVIKETFTHLGFDINDIIYDNKYNILKFTVSNIGSFNIQNLIDEYISNYSFRYNIEDIEKKILEHINKFGNKEVSLSLIDLDKNIFEQDPSYQLKGGNELFTNWMWSKMGSNNQVEDIFYIILGDYIELFLMKLYLNGKIEEYEKISENLYSVKNGKSRSKVIIDKSTNKVIFEYKKDNKKLIIIDKKTGDKYLLKTVELDSYYDYLSLALFEIEDGIITTDIINKKYTIKLIDLSDLKKHLGFNKILNTIFFQSSNKRKLIFNRKVTEKILKDNKINYNQVLAFLKQKKIEKI